MNDASKSWGLFSVVCNGPLFSYEFLFESTLEVEADENSECLESPGNANGLGSRLLARLLAIEKVVIGAVNGSLSDLLEIYQKRAHSITY